MKKRVLSGIKPSGFPHIGNYLGAMRHHVELQKDYDGFYFVADLHALTEIKDRKLLKSYIRGVALDYLAIGLDPDKCTFFRQSDIPGVSELSWILSSVTPMGLLSRCHAYKDALARKKKNINHGLFAYPVLMAADILIYHSDLVPVGKDQTQHVEVAREIARNFNTIYGKVFKEPEAMISKETALILGVDRRKMSKSYGNVIELFAPEEKVRQQVMSMVTDEARIKKTDPGHPDICNVFVLRGIFCEAGKEQLQKDCQAAKLGCVECKKMLGVELLDKFRPFREKRKRLEKKTDYIDDILCKGAQRAQKVAGSTMEKVKEAVGL